jgi:competence protein ComEC
LISDRWAIALACATAAGAFAARPLPLLVALAAGLVALLLRRPWALCVTAAVLASWLGARAWAGLEHPVLGPVAGVATLLSDPVSERGITEVDARLGDRRVRLRVAHGGKRTAPLADALAGERVHVNGTAVALESWERHLRVRHIAERVRVRSLRVLGEADPIHRAANALRRTIETGARVLPARQRPIFHGMLYGDDREQAADIADDFRAAGLGHLLAVSGQNVAFVLLLVQPAARRLNLATRWVVVLATVGFFALLTRFEPSVLRASSMAAVAVSAAAFGRHVRPARALALAVVALVLIDPLIVHSLGFQLSTAATAAIVLVAPALVEVLPGPRAVADALAVTLAAQLGVAPLLLTTFGPVPVAALPANLLATPAAALVMVWGLPAGLVAGATTPEIAQVLHLPTRALVGWVLLVARTSALAPVAAFGWIPIVVAAGAVVLLVGARNVRPRRTLRLGALLVVGALVVVAVRPVPSVPGAHDLAHGAVLWRGASGGVVIVVGERARAAAVLEGLRRARVRAVDAVAAERGADPETVAAVRERYGNPAVVDAASSGPGLRVGGLEITADAGRVRVRLGVGSPRGPARRSSMARRAPSRAGRRPRLEALRRDHPSAGDGNPQPHPRLLLRSR